MFRNGIYRKRRIEGSITELYTLYLEDGGGQLHYVMKNKNRIITESREPLVLGEAKQLIRALDLHLVSSAFPS